MEFNGGAANTNYWNATLFPNPPASSSPAPPGSYAWSSSVISGGTMAMTHQHEYIQALAVGTGTNQRAHCVSGLASPSFDMVDNGNGTILDKRTKLIWQKCANGQNNDSTCSGTLALTNWSNSLLYCKNLTLAGKSWRLPNAVELITLIDVNIATTPRVSATLFPNFGSTAQYDTSSANQANLAYTHVFMATSTGFAGISGKGVGNVYNARCVAGPE